MTSEPTIRKSDASGCKGRFAAWLIVPELDEHKGVRVYLYHHEELPEEVYRTYLHPLDHTDGYLRSTVEETFSGKEIEQLRDFFADETDVTFCTLPARPSEEGEMGVGAHAVASSHSDIFRWSECPLKISGHYDLRHANSGAWVELETRGMNRQTAANPEEWPSYV